MKLEASARVWMLFGLVVSLLNGLVWGVEGWVGGLREIFLG